jgi:hypothetical protein
MKVFGTRMTRMTRIFIWDNEDFWNADDADDEDFYLG